MALILRPTRIEGKYIREAREASESSKMRFKVGAVLVKKGRVLARSCNLYKSHPVFGTRATGFNFMHAEAAALYSCLKRGIDPSGGTIYLYRRNHRISKPCDHCQEILEDHGIVEVVYSA